MSSDLEGAAVYSEDGKRWGTVVDGEVQWHEGAPPTIEETAATFTALLATIEAGLVSPPQSEEA